MKMRITVWLMIAVAVLAWTGVAGAQAVPATPKVQLPNGETVWDLSGDWEALIEYSGPYAPYGTFTNVHRFTQTGSTFSAVRVKANPPPAPGRAGNPVWRGELGKDGFKRVEDIDSHGNVSPFKGRISDDGKKIVIEDGWSIKVTLTRP
jgi:hypothetical protein